MEVSSGQSRGSRILLTLDGPGRTGLARWPEGRVEMEPGSKVELCSRAKRRL